MLGANGIVGGGPPLVCGAALTAKIARHRRGRASPSSATAAPTRARSSRASTSPRSGSCRRSSSSRTTATPSRPSARYHQVGGRRRQARRRLRHARRRSSTASTSSPSTRRPARRSSAPAPAAARRLIECKVDRYFGHFEGDQQTYRGADEVDEAARATATASSVFRQRVTEAGLLERRRARRDRRGGQGADRRGRRRGQGGADADRRRTCSPTSTSRY